MMMRVQHVLFVVLSLGAVIPMGLATIQEITENGII